MDAIQSSNTSDTSLVAGIVDNTSYNNMNDMIKHKSHIHINLLYINSYDKLVTRRCLNRCLKPSIAFYFADT